MKKYLLILICIFFLTGCESKIEYTFNDNIESEININFTLDEYKKYISEYYGNDFDKEEENVIIESINSHRKVKAFMDTYDNLYKEKIYNANNNRYSATYTYIYKYSNFNKNNILNHCFESFNTSEDENAYYVNLGGESQCAGTKLIVNAEDRMINSNSKNINGSKYTWNITKENNNIYFAISKNPVKVSMVSPLHIVLFILGIVVGIVGFILNKKYKRNSY